MLLQFLLIAVFFIFLLIIYLIFLVFTNALSAENVYHAHMELIIYETIFLLLFWEEKYQTRLNAVRERVL